jgi:hypothetical protein
MIQQDQIKRRGNPNWKPGVSGNPVGRPIGARQKIAEHVLSTYEGVLGEDPATSLRDLRTNDPGKFWSIAASLLPREVELSVHQAIPGGLDPRDWSTLNRVLDLIQNHAPEGTEPEQIFAFIEHALRAEFAKPIIGAPPY